MMTRMVLRTSFDEGIQWAPLAFVRASSAGESGKADREVGSIRGFTLKSSAQGFDALAHSAQPIAFYRRTAAPVVPEFPGGNTRWMASDANSQLRAWGVPGPRLVTASRTTRATTLSWAEVSRTCLDSDLTETPAVFQGGLRALDFRLQAMKTVTADRASDFSQGGARSLLDLCHLGFWRVSGSRSISFSGKLGLQDNDRERVSEHIVQIAGNAFAFRNFGKMLNFSPGPLSACRWPGFWLQKKKHWPVPMTNANGQAPKTSRPRASERAGTGR